MTSVDATEWVEGSRYFPVLWWDGLCPVLSPTAAADAWALSTCSVRDSTPISARPLSRPTNQLGGLPLSSVRVCGVVWLLTPGLFDLPRRLVSSRVDGRSEAEIFAALGRDAGPQQGALYTAICNAEQGESDAPRETDTASTHPLRNQSGYLIPANEGSDPVSRDPNLPAEKIRELNGNPTRHFCPIEAGFGQCGWGSRGSV